MAARVLSRRNLYVLCFLAVAGLAAAAASSYLLLSNSNLVNPLRVAAEQALTERTGLAVTLGQLRPAPFGMLILEGASAREESGRPLLLAERVTINLSLWSWLKQGGRLPALVSRVELLRPKLELARSDDGIWNFARYTGSGEPGGLAWEGAVAIRKGEVTVRGWSPTGTAAAGSPLRLTEVNGSVVAQASGRLQVQLNGETNLLPGAKISARARLDGENPARVDFSLRGVELARVQRLFPAADQYGRLTAGQGDVQGSVVLGARPRVLSASGTVRGASFRPPSLDTPLSELSGEFSWRGDAVEVRHLAFSFLDTRWTAGGKVTRLSDPLLDLKISGENASLEALSTALPSVAGGIKLSGRASLELAARGALNDPLLTGFLRLSGVSASAPGGALPVTDLNGTVELAGSGLRTERLNGLVAGGQASLSGEVRDWKRPHGSVKLKLAGVPAEQLRRLLPKPAAAALRPLVEGRVSAELELEGSLADPAVQGRLSLVGARWADLPVDRAEVELAYAGGQATLSQVALAAAGGRLTGTASVSGLTGGTPQYTFSGRVDQVDAARLASTAGLRLPVAVAGRVSGLVAGQGRGRSWEGLSATGSLTVTDASIAGEPFAAAQAGFTLNQGEVLVDYLNVSSPDGELSGFGQMSRDGRLSGVLNGRNLKLAAVSRRIGGLPLDGSADLLAEVSGSLEQPELSGEFVLASPSFRGEVFAGGSGRFRLTREALSLEEAVVRRQETVLQVSGQIGLTPELPLDLTLTAGALPAGHALSLAGVEADLTGTADGTVILSGPARKVVAAGQLTLTDGRVAGYAYRRAAAGFRYAGGTLDVEHLEVEADGLSATGEGRLVGRNLDFSFAADRLDFARLPLPGQEQRDWTGTGSFKGTLRGTLSHPVLEGELRGSKVAYRAYAVDGLAGSLRYQNGKITLREMNVARGSGRYLLSGEVEPGPGQLDLRLRFDQSDLGDLARMAQVELPYQVTGKASGVVHVWGGFKSPSARLIAETDGARLGGANLAGDVDLALRGGEVTINRLRLGEVDGDGLVVALGRIGRSEVDLEARVRRIEVGPLASLFGLTASLTGQADAVLTAKGPAGDPKVDLTVSVANARAGETALDEVRAKATYSGGAIEIEEMVVASGEHRLTVSGTAPLPPARLSALGLKQEERAWDLEVSMAQGDLGILAFLAPNLRLSGPGSLSLHVTGPAEAPQAAGEIVARGARVSHPALGEGGEVTGLTGRLEVGPAGLSAKSLTGVYNGGETKVSGQVTLAGLKPKELDLTLTGRNVHYKNPVFEAWIDADLTVRGPFSDAVVAGRATLDRSTLTLGAKTKPRRIVWNPRLDITVKSREDMRVVTTSRIIDARAYGTLTMRGRFATPTFSGEAEASRGTIVYLDTPFRITRGTASFSAYRGMYPTLDVTAEASLSVTPPAGDSGAGGETAGTGLAGKTLRVTLGVTGTMGDLTLNLSSDPPLSQAEIAAALSLPGDISRIIEGDSAGAGLEEELVRMAGQQLSNRVFSGLEVAVADALQLDELTLAPGFREQNIQLHFGKYLVDNVYLTYSRTFDLDPWENIGLEYRIYEGLTFTSSYDNRGEFQWALEARHRF